MTVSCTYRIVEDLIDRDRACVKYRVMRPMESVQEKYDQTVVCRGLIKISYR